MLGVLAAQACSEDGPQVRVFAAASLREVVDDMAEDFEAAHPQWSVRAVYAGSQTLRLQAEAGASFDLFMSAHAEHLDRLHASGRCDPPRVMAGNRLALVVPEGSSTEDLEGLAKAERIVLGSREVPLGRYTEEFLGRAARTYGENWAHQVRDQVASRERSARLVRAKLSLGEAGAAIVYATDADGLSMRRIPIEDGLNPRANYVAASSSELGRRFLAWVEGPKGRARLAERGFLPP